jgi:hypothetical protein
LNALTKTKLYKFTNTSLTFGLGILLFYFLFKALRAKDIPLAFLQLDIGLFSGICIALALSLTFFNWAIEAYKWNALIKKIHRLSMRELISSIALGLCANILAPNRTGELAARLTHIPPNKRREGLYLNLFAASSQFLITILAGIWAATYLLPQLGFFNGIGNAFVYLFTFSIAIACLSIFFKSRLLGKLLLKKLHKQDQNGEVVEIPMRQRIEVFSLSVLRYLIFLMQFYLILLAIEARVNFIDASLILAISFLLNGFIPSNWLTEVVTKSSVIYFISELLQYDPVLTVSASVGLWIINLLIPSSLSIYFLKDVDWMRLIRS